MSRCVLALNVGSTTLKAAVYALGDDADALVEERDRVEVEARGDVETQLASALDRLALPGSGPEAVIHRIVHGGERPEGCELDERLLAQLEELAPLAPMHQPQALAFVRAARMRWPQARQGVAFDTSFHAALAPWSRRLPIPAEWDALGVRRYGFHGLAFASALRAAACHDARIREARAVFAHLGGGCSVCAVEAGRSRDTTMALTPLGGVPGPTRCGDLDPGALLYLLRRPGVDADALEAALSHRSGLAGIAGHADVRLLLDSPTPAAQLAIEQFVVRIAQAIAAMATGIGGVEHLVFSGGIGHRAPAVRARIVARLAWLGLRLDCDRNDAGAMRIDAGTGPAIWNVAVDEERELAESARAWL